MSSVPSPCQKLCRLDAARKTCTDCHRTLMEIARWGTMSDEERRATLAACSERGAAHRG